MDSNSVEQSLHEIDEQHYASVAEVGERLFRERVVPFCKKYGLNFYSGMGIYFFERRRDRLSLNNPMDDLDMIIPHFKHSGPKWEEYCAIHEMLKQQSHLMPYPLGSVMNQYIAKGKAR